MNKNLSQSNTALQENLNPLESKVENKVESTNQNEIVLFDSIKEESSSIQFYSNHADNLQIEVLCYNETVWLNREQLAKLFGRDIKTIGKHINNALKEELKDFSVVAKFATTKDYGRRTGFTQTLNIEYYNLEMITSIGYRVKSKQGILFRQWANKVLKEYLLRGYAVNQRVNQLEDKVDRRFAEYDRKLENLNEQVDFFVKTSLPPKEKVFFDGQLFDAHVLMSRLVESADKRIVLIDNYIDESVLTLLLKRRDNVLATIYTMQMSSAFKLDLQKHNAQYPPIVVNIYTKAHDRFLIVDDKVYHVGASIKDLGKKLCAVSLLSCIDADEMINKL